MIEVLKNLGTFLFYFVASLGGAAVVCRYFNHAVH